MVQWYLPSIAQLVERWTVVGSRAEIHRSLVQIRLEGGNFSFQQKLSQTVSKAPTRLTHVSKLQTNSVWRIFLQFGRQE